MRIDTDLLYCINNGTLAIQPTSTGRLAALVRTVHGTNYERVWVFGDADPWTHPETGFEFVDHHRRGVMVGTWKQGQEFLAVCKELGLVVSSGGLFVPFSNGQYRFGKFGDGAEMSDYAEDELRLARWDLPTRDELVALLAK